MEENKIPTIEQYFKEYHLHALIEEDSPEYKHALIIANGYANLKAKYHVEAALKAASETAWITNDEEIDKDSILNAYPLVNIK